VRTWVNVARYHLVQPMIYLGLPWAIMAFSFAVNLIIFHLAPGGRHYTGAVAVIYLFFFIMVFIYGMWFGLVRRRWSLPGTVTFIAAQVTALLAVALLITWAHAWPGTGRFFSTLSAVGLTGLLAVLAATLLAGGYATVRRVTV